jgi:anti-sigma factor RsiW
MLESLENNEVILLMYLAGELPPVDRQEVEQMLAGDGGLRRELETLQAAQGVLHGGLARLDQIEPLSNQATLTRRIGRAMRQHFVDRAAQARTPARAKAGFPWWAYPTAVAAAIFLAFTLWVISFNFGSHHSLVVYPANDGAVAIVTSGGSLPATAPSTTDVQPAPTPAQLAQELENSFGGGTEKEDNQMVALQVDPQPALGGDLNE